MRICIEKPSPPAYEVFALDRFALSGKVQPLLAERAHGAKSTRIPVATDGTLAPTAQPLSLGRLTCGYPE